MGRTYQQRKAGRWSIDYLNAEGRRVREAVADTEENAKITLRERERRELLIKEGVLSRISNHVPVAEIREKYETHVALHCRAQTVRSYKGHLDTVLGFLRVEHVGEITPTMMDAFLEHRVSAASTRTANMGLVALKSMFNWAVSARLIESNPIQGVKPLRQTSKRLRRALTEAEAHALLTTSSERYRRIWFGFLTTGLRHKELTTLRWDDVDFERNTIRIRGEVSKTWQEGGLPMNPELAAMLRAMKREANPDDTAPVFLNQRGAEIRNNLLRAFRRCAEKASIARHGTDIHCLRYTFGAHLIRRGASIKTVQRLMRHKTASMTLDVYAQYFTDDGDAAVRNLPFTLGITPASGDASAPQADAQTSAA